MAVFYSYIHRQTFYTPQDIGIVTRVIIFGPGTQQASICKPSAVQSIQDMTKQTPP
jgi:hypothetical protein